MSSRESVHSDNVSLVTVLVKDSQSCRILHNLEMDMGLTLWAVMSEDPTTWEELVKYWPRYRCPVVSEFLESVPAQELDMERAVAEISGQKAWIVFDLKNKRIFYGGAIEEIERDALFLLDDDQSREEAKNDCGQRSNDGYRLPIHLPPWWELHPGAEPSHVLKVRATPIEVPYADRQLLYGRPLLQDLATRMIRAVAAGRVPSAESGRQAKKESHEVEKQFYSLMVDVHKDWLMTVRDDLKGRKPRDLLHGAHQWIDAVIEGQRLRFDKGAPMIAAPDDVEGYDCAPIGREEMILYFDLCRELITAGLQWCQSPIDPDGRPCKPNRLDALIEFLARVRDYWLQEPFEGGSPPQFIIDCSRRRVPRAVNVPIEGMDQVESGQHVGDCNCPICEMMASGMLGVTFDCLDGHHLELDDEFAFSMEHTYEDWQFSRCAWDSEDEDSEDEDSTKEYSDFEDSDEQLAEEEATDLRLDLGPAEKGNENKGGWKVGRDGSSKNTSAAEGFVNSVWSSPMTEDPVPGDARGYLKLAFRLAEIISYLQYDGAADGMTKQLNEAFRQYTQSSGAAQVAAKQSLFETLEAVGHHHPQLLSKAVDFQSLVDENHRQKVS